MRVVLNIGLENNRFIDPRTYDISPLIRYLDLYEIDQYHVSESKWRNEKERVLVATIISDNPVRDIQDICKSTGQEAIAAKWSEMVYREDYEGEIQPFNQSLFIDEIDQSEFNYLNK